MRRFSFSFEFCCLCKGFSRYLKKKSGTYINNEVQTQKYLIPKQKLNRFDHKSYKWRWILKFEFVFIINNRDCDTMWTMSFCFSTRIIYLGRIRPNI